MTEQPDQPELFSTEQEQEYTNITTGIPPALHNRMISDWIKGGEVSEESLRAAANEIPGADLDVIRERVGRTLELFSKPPPVPSSAK